ncbi:MAG: VWA domain-containing protein, partial [Blastocatellia bacterium]|nr:VWA domain-containing protein [Blastocatellia bacterium]
MKTFKSLFVGCLILTFLLTNSLALQDNKPQNSEDPNVVRIGVKLVQVDAVVVDKQGNVVNNLQPEDFEIYEDGKKQEITNFSFIAFPRSEKASSEANTTLISKAEKLPALPLKPEQVRRTIALVVDDVCISQESIIQVRQGLKKFIDEQMREDDLVAILRTGSGIGALQQFTNNKQKLQKDIARLVWSPNGCGRLVAVDPINNSPALNLDKSRENRSDNPPDRTLARVNPEDLRNEAFTIGTLGAVSYIVKGLKDLPGRKSVVLFSDGLQIFAPDRDSNRVRESFNRLTDLANNSSVVFYGIDARGLQTLGITAGDSINGAPIGAGSRGISRSADPNFTTIAAETSLRQSRFFDSQEGLNLMARDTGGLFIRNTSDMAKALDRVVQDQSGYYLLGYVPDEERINKDSKLKTSTFHKLEVKLKKSGLTVRSRTGFLANTEPASSKPLSPTEQLSKAIVSPFSSSGLSLKLTATFLNDAQAGNYLQALIYIDGKDLVFKKSNEGQQAQIDIVGLLFGDNGNVVDQESNSITISLNEDGYQQALKNGIVQTVNLPVKKPGSYQFRIAVRDASSSQVGSASQYIEIPDISKGAFHLSGIVIAGRDRSNPEAVDPMASPAVRKFKKGMVMDFGYLIYNAQQKNSSTALEAKTILYKDGLAITNSDLKPLELGQQPDLKRIVTGGQLNISKDFQPGSYLLQVIVLDKNGKKDKN